MIDTQCKVTVPVNIVAPEFEHSQIDTWDHLLLNHWHSSWTTFASGDTTSQDGPRQLRRL